MPLQADPTIKFALKDFSLKRIYEKYLLIESPYNTYRNKGLPPGPICTPSQETIDEVLNSPETGYLYFVAKSDLSGGSVFTTTLRSHEIRQGYQQSLINRTQFIKRDRARNDKVLRVTRDLFVSSPPVTLIVGWSKKIHPPGFQGIPLYDVIKFFFAQVRKVGMLKGRPLFPSTL